MPEAGEQLQELWQIGLFRLLYIIYALIDKKSEVKVRIVIKR